METTLNLYNFDHLDADSARYVLTSPRSLEACSRMKVKPVELLPKSLDDFIKESNGKSIDFIQILYNDCEEKRVSLLQKCRKERERIIMEQKVAKNNHKQPLKPSQKNSKSVSKLEKSNKTTVEKKLQTKSLFDTSNSLVITTFEPSRTPTPDDHPPAINDLSLSPAFARCPGNMFVNKRDGLRSRSVEAADRHVKLHPGTVSLRSPSVFGDNSPLPSGYTTPQIQRDKKLVEVMKQRRKKDELDGKMRYEKAVAWSLEKSKHDRAKKQEAIKRHKELSSNHVEWERKLKEEELRRIAKAKEAEMERLRRQEIAEAATKSNKEKQDRLRLHHIEARKKAADQRKLLQEKALNAAHHDVMMFQLAVEEEINTKQHKANQAKLEKEAKELEKVKLMNRKEKERLSEIRKEIKKREEEKKEMMRGALKEKLQRASENYSKKISTRDLALKSQSKQVEEKMLQTRRLIRKINNENEIHLQSMMEHTNERLVRAGEAALKSTESKSDRAKAIRASSEKEWRKKQLEIREQDQLHLQKMKENLERKESKLRRHIQLREAAFEFSRVQAKINEAERELVKRSTSNFNEMAQKAKLAASVGHGPRSSFVNFSTVKLG